MLTLPPPCRLAQRHTNHSIENAPGSSAARAAAAPARPGGPTPSSGAGPARPPPGPELRHQVLGGGAQRREPGLGPVLKDDGDVRFVLRVQPSIGGLGCFHISISVEHIRRTRRSAPAAPCCPRAPWPYSHRRRHQADGHAAHGRPVGRPSGALKHGNDSTAAQKGYVQENLSGFRTGPAARHADSIARAPPCHSP